MALLAIKVPPVQVQLPNGWMDEGGRWDFFCILLLTD